MRAFISRHPSASLERPKFEFEDWSNFKGRRAELESVGPAPAMPETIINMKAGRVGLIDLLFVRDEAPNEIGHLIGRGIQRKVPGIEDVNFSLRNVTAVRLGLRLVKR